MQQYLITFRSLTHAQHAARLLERRGVTATVIRAPAGLSAAGCAYAVTLRREPEEAVRWLRRQGVRVGKLFERGADGVWTEVKM